MTDKPRYELTGIPLVDAVVRALLAAYDEGHAGGRGDQGAKAAAHQKTLHAIAEVQRLYGQLEIEVRAARQAPATAYAGGGSSTSGDPRDVGGEEGGRPTASGGAASR